MPTIKVTTPIVASDGASVEYLILDLPNIVNECQLGVQIVKIGPLRETVAAMIIAPAKASHGAITGSVTLIGKNPQPGIYAINHVAIKSSDGMHSLFEPEAITGLPAYFKVSGNRNELPVSQNEIEDLACQREALITTEAITSASAAAALGSHYSVFVFCAPTLLHHVHHLEGYSIYPLTGAISEESYRQAMNAFTIPSLGVSLQSDEKMSQNFRSGAPAVVIALHRVRAVSPDDAIEYAMTHAKQVAVVLGIGRGHKPSPFGVVTYDGNEVRHGYIVSNYKGNKAWPMFDEIESDLEHLLPKAQRSPWARLIMSDYAAATAEVDHGFQYLRYWSLIEQIAKRHITSASQNIFFPNGDLIRAKSGTPVLTKNVKAKVYAHLMSTGVIPGVSGIPTGETLHFEGHEPNSGRHSDEVIPLWNWIGAAYNIRNSVAHTGEYQPNLSATPQSDEYWAAKLYSNGTLFGQFRDTVKMAMFHELSQITV